MDSLSNKYFEKYKNLSIEELIKLDNRTLNSIFLELYYRRSKEIEPYDVLEKYEDNYEFFCPSREDLKTINDFERIFLDSLPDEYIPIELSPIMPFGCNSSITNLNQKNILTTSRNSEVCSDITTALTFESCKRRKEIKKDVNRINETVNLATSNKVLRMQRFDKSKGYLQHFSQFAAVSSGRKNSNFELNKYKEHIKLWVDILLKYIENDYSIGKLNVGLCHIDIIEHFIKNEYIPRDVYNKNSFNDVDVFKELNIFLPDKLINYDELTDKQIEIYKLKFIKKYIMFLSEIVEELSNTYPNVNFYIEMNRKGGLGYYVGSCFHIYSDDGDAFVPLCDGGIPDWNKKILRDNKETSIVSGIGSELILNLYKKR